MKSQAVSRQLNVVWPLFTLAILSLATAIFSLAIQLKPDRKIVYVDALKLISEYKGTEVVRKNLTDKKQVYKANLDTLRTEAEHALQNYEKAKPGLNSREKGLMEELVRSKQQQYLNYEQLVRDQSKKEDQELSSKVLNTVNDYIKRYGEREGYAIILSATHYGNIAYGDETLDITDQILTGLNKEFESTKKF